MEVPFLEYMNSFTAHFFNLNTNIISQPPKLILKNTNQTNQSPQNAFPNLPPRNPPLSK